MNEATKEEGKRIKRKLMKRSHKVLTASLLKVTEKVGVLMKVLRHSKRIIYSYKF